MHAALAAGAIVPAPDEPTLADGLAGNLEPGSITFPIVQQFTDGLILVDEAQIAAALRWIFHEHHLVVEGAAAVTVAALLNGLVADIADRPVVVLLCGRNVAGATFTRVLAEG
jgi:threonine dehydratase